jgi:hypothetical protein
MRTYENAAATAIDERELSIGRLTQIDGIARKTAEAMYEEGIRGHADLIQYLNRHTARQVSSALREHGVNRPPAFIDRVAWARQARELGELENILRTPPEEKKGPAEREQEAPSGPHPRAHDAVFTVFFDAAADGDRQPVLRTTVCEGANGGQERVFQGSQAAPWVNWILERANLSLAVERIATQEEAVSSPAPAEPGDARIEIGDVRLSVVGPTADDPARRLGAEVSFQLYGRDAERLASRRVPFRTEAHTVNVESGVSERVAFERGQLVPEVFEYVSRQEFDIPEVGRYEFHSLVLLLPPGKAATYHSGPTLRVVP